VDEGLSVSGLEGLREGGAVTAVVGRVAAILAGRPHIADAEWEARDLVAAWLDQPRHWPLLHADESLDADQVAALLRAGARRAAGAPLAYAVGKANFRRLTLAVDERVLIPRPETELLVDLVLANAPPGGTAIDVGTGSGAIAIALATEGRFDRVIATDISRDALDVARLNAAAARAEIEFRLGDLLDAARERNAAADSANGVLRSTSHVVRKTSNALDPARLSAVVANPPYISFEEIRSLPAAVRDWEPALALFSGRDGLSVTARLVRQAAQQLVAGGLLALEVDARRASLVAELVAVDARFRAVSVQADLAGRERFVLATRRETEDQ
jgi:release factor glutamine methyltransferase